MGRAVTEIIVKVASRVCEAVIYGLVAALVFLAARPAQAQTLGLHVATWHDRSGYNNINPGVYVRTDSGFTAGAYRNSIRKPSVHAGYTWAKPTSFGDISLTAGAVTGYDRPLQPLLVPSIRAGHTRLTILPRADPKGAAGAHLSWEF